MKALAIYCVGTTFFRPDGRAAKKSRALVRLGQNLWQAREAQGWSQEELAARCGVHRTYIGGVERAEYNVTILTLRRISKTLRISLLESLRGV